MNYVIVYKSFILTQTSLYLEGLCESLTQNDPDLANQSGSKIRYYVPIIWWIPHSHLNFLPSIKGYPLIMAPHSLTRKFQNGVSHTNPLLA